MTRSQIAFAVLFSAAGCLSAVWLLHTPEESSLILPIAEKTSSAQTHSPQPQQDIVEEREASIKITLPAPMLTRMSDDAQAESESRTCNQICRQFVESLQGPEGLMNSERLPSGKLVVELRHNLGLRIALANMAIEESGDTRRLIIDAFTQLEPRSQRALGRMLSEAPERNQRLDGINLLANPTTMNPGVPKWLASRLDVEQNVYVRSALVKALNQPNLFAGDAKVVEALSRVLQTGGDASVRGEALLAMSRLQDNPEDSLADSLSAIRSDSSEYQEYGVLALEQIMTRQTLGGLELDSNSNSQITQLVDELMNPEFNNMSAQARKSVDDLYSRFY